MEIKKKSKIGTVFGYRHQNYTPGTENNTLIFIKKKWNIKGKLTINLDNSTVTSKLTTYRAIIDAKLFVNVNDWVKMSLYEIFAITGIKIDGETEIVDIYEITAKCSCNFSYFVI